MKVARAAGEPAAFVRAVCRVPAGLVVHIVMI